MPNNIRLVPSPPLIQQSSGPEVISRFAGKHFFLSNFFPCAPRTVFLPTEFCGTDDRRYWPTVEHAYQAAKGMTFAERTPIFEASSASQAKRLGQVIPVRQEWEEVKLAVMLNLLVQKFRDPQLREKLLRTGSAKLVEGNWWKDSFWGVSNGVGQNHLGRLLEVVRWNVLQP